MEDILFKHRFGKRYRHPDLDETLTRQRLIGEARTLMRCLRTRAADWGGAKEISMDLLMEKIGVEIAKLHLLDIIHGDLTTSNMLLRASNNDLVMIDFGLAYHSALVEDKAVDLYVLERAFASTHPDSESLFASILAAYANHIGKDWDPIKKRLDEVRLRGRKRTMVG
ncbi:hypothetical protein HD554DRAFT_2086661 [Boletus coccyginus]|nr:hypothetical protein HD554DRAFT_2086661 [Boletus coccyginus]